MKAYGDIWRIDMVDTYADLALKTLKMFSILPARVDADFYFKVDDDVAMNVGAMAEYLQSKRTQGNLYLVRVVSDFITVAIPDCCATDFSAACLLLSDLTSPKALALQCEPSRGRMPRH